MPIWSPDGQCTLSSLTATASGACTGGCRTGAAMMRSCSNPTSPSCPCRGRRTDDRIVFGMSDSQGDLWVLPLERAAACRRRTPNPKPSWRHLRTRRTDNLARRPLDRVRIERNEGGSVRRSTSARSRLARVAGRCRATGGDWPRWGRDGKELFFLSNVPAEPDQTPGTLSAVKVGAKGDTFIYEPPVQTVQFRAINLDHPGGDFPSTRSARTANSWCSSGPTWPARPARRPGRPSSFPTTKAA